MQEVLHLGMKDLSRLEQAGSGLVGAEWKLSKRNTNVEKSL